MDQLKQRIALPLEEKEELSRTIIREALSRVQRPAIGFSGGKKSVALLYLLRQEYTLPIKSLHVRTAHDFEAASLFMEELKKLWRFELEIGDAAETGLAADPQLCCKPSVSATLRQLAQTHAIDLLLLGNSFEDLRGIRLPDETGLRCLDPIFHFSDRDLRDFAQKHKIPMCSLYGEGYGKIDCRRCTLLPAAKPVDANAEEEEKLFKEKMKRLGYL